MARDARAGGGGMNPTQSTTASTSFQSYIQPISIPWSPRPLNPDEAKATFKYLEQNLPAIYNQFKANVALLGIPNNKKNLQKIFNDAVDWTQVVGSQSGNPLDYFNVLNPADYVEEEKKKKYGTGTQKGTTVTEYSTSSAAAIINQAFEKEIGTEASKKELKAGQVALNLAAAQEPATYQATTTTSPGGSVTTAKQGTGFNAAEFAKNYARTMPQYAESFAAKDFLSDVQKLIQSPAKIGRVIE
jgi:hypothetical protein